MSKKIVLLIVAALLGLLLLGFCRAGMSAAPAEQVELKGAMLAQPADQPEGWTWNASFPYAVREAGNYPFGEGEVPIEVQGQSCNVTFSAQNNESHWVGNNVIVSSTTSVTFYDVERSSSKPIVLGSAISAEFNVAAKSSMGGTVTVTCQYVPATETPTPTSTVQVTSTATITPTETTVPTETPTGTLPPTETPLPTETPSPTPGATSTPEPTREPRLPACLRINFDVSGHEARRGLYVVQEVGGRFLVGWEADDGWKDSGWFYDIDITFKAVYVDVLYYHGPGVEPVRLKMWNPAPDTESGWLGRGMCHALEVGWP